MTLVNVWVGKCLWWAWALLQRCVHASMHGDGLSLLPPLMVYDINDILLNNMIIHTRGYTHMQYRALMSSKWQQYISTLWDQSVPFFLSRCQCRHPVGWALCVYEDFHPPVCPGKPASALDHVIYIDHQQESDIMSSRQQDCQVLFLAICSQRPKHNVHHLYFTPRLPHSS